MSLTRANGDYLRWSAKSFEDLLTIKAVQDGRFTDQLFKGSNLSILVDLISYSNETNLFYLNTAASEAMFADSQYYENINRIVKLLNYFPNGFLTSSVSVTLSTLGSALEAQTLLFPKYTTWDTTDGAADESGFPVSYSLVDDYYVSFLGNDEVDPTSTPVLYNGRWKFYPQVYSAAGTPSETFTVKISTAATQPIKIAHPFIDVYIKSINTNTYEKWNRVANLYDFSDNVSKDYEIRVDENKDYTVKFGDGVFGRKLKQGDQLFILFLQTNGVAGKTGIGSFSPGGRVLVEGLVDSFVWQSLLGYDASSAATTQGFLSEFTATRESASTEPKDFETPDEIRTNAPNWFRSQGKLNSQRDFERYIISNYSGTNEVHDVVCMNNTEYMNEFMGWLYDLGKLSSELVYYGYKFSDSCNFNNVYLWIKSSSNGNVPLSVTSRKIIQDSVGKLKPLTSEVIPFDPFLVSFAPCLPQESTPSWSSLSSSTFTTDYYFEIERDRGALVTVEGLRRKTVDIITQFFNVSNNSLGQSVDLGSLQSQIKAIGGVKSINTIWHPATSPKALKREPGLWMAYWTPLLARGADFNVFNNSVILKRFQFPFLYNSSTLVDRIRIIGENFKINAFEY